jgi:hypothetical protein
MAQIAPKIYIYLILILSAPFLEGKKWFLDS